MTVFPMLFEICYCLVPVCHYATCMYLSAAGEEISETARREVLEETGIDSEFVGILCMRHQHNFRYGCSDLYYVCLMKALTTNIKQCEQELSACTWMDVG